MNQYKKHLDSVLGCYDDSLDHGKPHIMDVVKNAMRYMSEYRLDERESMIVETACYYHDIGLTFDRHHRKDHHIVAYDVVLKKKELKQFFNDHEITQIALCCFHHRSSSNADDLTLLQKIVHDADNSIDLKTILTRCLFTRFGQLPKENKTIDQATYNWLMEDVWNYLVKKHGSKGYKKFHLPLPETSLKELEFSKRMIDSESPIIVAMIRDLLVDHKLVTAKEMAAIS